MVAKHVNSFLGWLETQSANRRLWLMICAICAGLGLLSAVLPDPPPKSVATANIDAVALGDQRPGAAGRAVKTVVVPAPVDRKAAPAAGPEIGKEARSTTVGVSDGQPKLRLAAAPVTEAPGGRPTKDWRTAEASGGVAKTVPKNASGDEAQALTPLKVAKTNMKIQSITSPGGVSAWLVEEHSVPLLALRFVFDGGNSQDPTGKEGVANFMTAMMDEGAGDLDSAHFQERMEELAVRMSFEDARDSLYGNFETLSANRDAAIDMLRLAVNKPRFDTDAVERIRKQLLANLAYAAKNPERVASQAWTAAAFPAHPYGRPANGTLDSVKAIQPSDLEMFRKRTFSRGTLKVVAVGDIDAKALGAILDRVFGDLPAKADLVAVPQTDPKPAMKMQVIEMNVPQSVVQFGMPGLARKDPDFMAAYVMNHILGGGGFASRLTEQVREKRGLAYSVYSYLQPFRKAALFAGGVATKNAAVKESIDVIKAELQRMATEGPTEKELESAKSYLTGSFALRFDTNSKIASQLLSLLNEDLGIDYVDKRNALVEAVTLEDVKRAAARILKVDNLLVTVVGKPQGLNPG